MTRDPGLQPERTALAWQRTGVVGALVGGVAVIAAAHRHSLVLLGVTALLTAVSAAAAGHASTPPQAGLDGIQPSPWPRLVSTAAVPVLIAVAGVVLALTP